MIQATTNTNLTTYLQTEDNRINTAIARANIKHLCKFTNDMDGSVDYAYGNTETIYDRYTKFTFLYNATPNRYTGRINFLPAGYWKYEIYEVSWVTLGGGELMPTIAPSTENAVLLPAADTKGVVEGLVTKGKMYVDESVGKEEVTYIQNAKSVQTLTIASGGAGYTTAPAIVIIGDCISQATATCTVLGSVVNTVTITNAGSGYTENPTVIVSGGGASSSASITADINETNYIYTG